MKEDWKDFSMGDLFEAVYSNQSKPGVIAVSQAVYDSMPHVIAEQKLKEKLGRPFAGLGLNKRIKG